MSFTIPYLLIIAFLAVFATSLIVFALVGDQPERFAFSGQALFQGQVWRLATFPFTHVTLAHLLENLIALIVITIFGYQVGLTGRQFIICFLGASFIIALTEAPILPSLLIAGASVGVLSISGFVSLSGRHFIPAFILIPILLLPVIIQYIFSRTQSGAVFKDTMGLVLHIAGFIVGIGFFLAFKYFKKNRYILHQTS